MLDPPPDAAVPPTESNPTAVATRQEEQYLTILAVFYYVFAGLCGLGACLGIFYLGLGAIFALAPQSLNDPNLDESAAMWLGLLIAGMGLLVVALSLGVGILQFMTGRCLNLRRRRTFCMVIAGITCLSVPLGTALGVCTLVVLARPSVRGMFERGDGAT